ncbi:MAG: carboxypeptidase G2 [Candidatus Ozemobacter sibiricus]|jgi:glutamate carboxypeptidase|uniref:Carboxypeptidase G2 n=1 Tax=Candidatus Ozemobacter sibiricus TaxID=2268124 RepID=A0A367ZMF5_9BACT|nr:MAG: carboxypeptidase G2 [Candidatus Ozemobacter sibiricus]
MIHRLRDFLSGQQATYLEALRKLVATESPSNDKAAADRCADEIAHLLTHGGFAVERRPMATIGDVLIGRFAPRSAERGEATAISAADSTTSPTADSTAATMSGPTIDAAASPTVTPTVGSTTGQGDSPLAGPRTLLLAHYDTVWPVGTLTQMPFTHDGDVIRGPGVADMKAGIVAGALAVAALTHLGRAPAGPVTFLVTSDEETGSTHSRPLIEELARQHDRVLVLEPAREDGALKVGRKGVGNYTVTFRGRSAHAGTEPERGASALRELAHFLFAAETLSAPDRGTTVNLTVARGGSATNVIAEEAVAALDVRVLAMVEAERVDRALRAYRPHDDRVSLTIDGGLNRPPFEPGPRHQPLFERCRTLGHALGLALEAAVVGGGSDGNFTAALGVPTLDGLGAVGGGCHARHEYIRLAASLDRVALLAAFLATA